MATSPPPGGTDRPVAPWTGRLLFDPTSRLPSGSVRLELHNAPSPQYSDLIDTNVVLKWDPNDIAATSFAKSATTEKVRFNDEARESSAKGVVHPVRLDGLDGVGPLESLAGSRPEDDVYVSLAGRVEVIRDGDDDDGHDDAATPALLIRESPIQIKGRVKCLIKFVKGSDDRNIDASSPSSDPSSTSVEVAHYNPETQSFDRGFEETMRFRPFGPVSAAGTQAGPHYLRRFTFRGIENSPANDDGWYVYGERGDDGVFSIEAIEPRRCLRLRPDEVYFGEKAGMDYLRKKNWAEQQSRKGTVGSVLVDPAANTADADADADADAVSNWKVGDRALVIHLYGGLKGLDTAGIKFDERTIFPSCLSLVPGHFSYGDATVVTCPFTEAPVFEITHRQVFCHGRLGVISGPNAWHSFMGDLYRGFLGNRAVTDILVKFPPATRTYGVEGQEAAFDPLGEYIRELNEMGAKYRTGGGTGSFLVGIDSNCSQDSNQALFAALREAEEEAEQAKDDGGPSLGEWLSDHPDDSMTQDMASLKQLGEDLEAFLTPFGVRKDWRRTSKNLRGTEGGDAEDVGTAGMVVRALQTWRTMLPRRAFEGVASIFLRRGAKMWFVRTNQVGGIDEDITPLAPTLPFKGGDNESPHDDEEEKKCFW